MEEAPVTEGNAYGLGRACEVWQMKRQHADCVCVRRLGRVMPYCIPSRLRRCALQKTNRSRRISYPMLVPLFMWTSPCLADRCGGVLPPRAYHDYSTNYRWDRASPQQLLAASCSRNNVHTHAKVSEGWGFHPQPLINAHQLDIFFSTFQTLTPLRQVTYHP